MSDTTNNNDSGDASEVRDAQGVKVLETEEPDLKEKSTESKQPNRQRLQPIKIPAKTGDTLIVNYEDFSGPRRSSSVSFQDTCDLYEIDLEKNGKKVQHKPHALKSLRYFIMILALVSPFVTTYSRTIINFAITDMIEPLDMSQEQEQTTISNNQTTTTTTATAFNDVTLTPYFELDHSCPVSDSERARLIKENQYDVQRTHNSQGEKFKWSPLKQGMLKAAYAIGHTPIQIPGSRLSEIYGSHRVMSISSFLIAICCLSAPFLAALNFYLLFSDLVLLGALGSFMTPALITFFSNWLTPSEKSMMLSFYLLASRLGYALSSFLCGLLIQAQISWRYVFFSAGWVSFAFSSLFFLCARSRPQDHPLISQLELDYLASKNTLVKESLARGEEKQKRNYEMKSVNYVNQQQGQGQDHVVSVQVTTGEEKLSNSTKAVNNQTKMKKQNTYAPWLDILTNAPVWAFIITKFCVKFASDTVQIELPTYLKRVMHFTAKDNGIINGLNYVIFCGSCVGIGLLAKSAIKKRPFGLSKTAIRKIFQSLGSFGVSLCLTGIAYSVCNNTYTQIFLMLLFLLTTFSTGGEAQTPMDITERYSGTIHALGSSIAISGIIEPVLVGFIILGVEADRDSWKIIWLGAGGISFIGGLVYIIFADAKIQPFDNIDNKRKGKPRKAKKKTKLTIGGKVNKAFVEDTEVDVKVTGKNDNQNHSSEQDKKTLYRESVQI